MPGSRIVFMCLWLAATPVLAQVPWLPPDVEQATAEAMLERFAEAGVEIPGSPFEKRQGAIRAVRDLSGRIDGWGLDGVIDRAPALARIVRPDFGGDEIVGAIASFGFCSLPLHPELVTTEEEKTTVVLGEYSVMLLSAFLRDRYLARGGTDEELRDLLATSQMDQLSYRIQSDEILRQYVVDECGPLFEDLFGP